MIAAERVHVLIALHLRTYEAQHIHGGRAAINIVAEKDEQIRTLIKGDLPPKDAQLICIPVNVTHSENPTKCHHSRPSFRNR